MESATAMKSLSACSNGNTVHIPPYINITGKNSDSNDTLLFLLSLYNWNKKI